MVQPMKKNHSVSIHLCDAFLAPRQRRNLTATIPAALQRCRETGRLDAFQLRYTPGGDVPEPHIYWDSDVAKVMEGMAYVYNDDPEIASALEELVPRVISAQQPDGYLNTHYSVVNPDKRWSNLYNGHELYCAGHLMEAAVAHYYATNSRLFIDAMCHYADYICEYFGPNGVPGYPGHQEIELALFKLYRATGNKKYLDQAKLFIDRRGTEPNYFVEYEHADPSGLHIRQAHLAAKEQKEAVGHAVRAVYFYSGMADVASETGDTELLKTCEALFDDIVGKKMFITGGIGSSQIHESFGNALDLVSERSYAESCAAIGLIFFASRMLNIFNEVKYADAIERCIFNGAISGLSLDGNKFFYANLLSCHRNSLAIGNVTTTRQPWYSTSCCPTSYCRFLPQLGNFCYRATADRLSVDIPVAAEIMTEHYAVVVTSSYPYDGRVYLEITSGGEFELAFRIPSWCGKYTVPADGCVVGNYWRCRKHFAAGTKYEFFLDMPITLVHSCAPALAGKAAITRGPLVYCVEKTETDPVSPFAVRLSDKSVFSVADGDFLMPGCKVVKFSCGIASSVKGLYSEEPPVIHSGEAMAIPYALWQNRGEAEMTVFLPYSEK